MGRATTKRSNTGGDNDKATVGLADLVIDPRRPLHTPMIKIYKAALIATMKAGQFPQPIPGRGRGKGLRWRLRDVQAWMRRRAELNPATASPYADPMTTGSSPQAKPPKKARSPRIQAPSKSGACITVFTASPVSTHCSQSAPGELVPVTLDASDTTGGRRTEFEASEGTPGGGIGGMRTTAIRPGWVETHWPLFTHAPHRAYAGSAITRSDAIFYFYTSPYGRTHRTPHHKPPIRHQNGPQEAYDALALPTYPFVRGGLVGLPGGLA